MLPRSRFARTGKRTLLSFFRRGITLKEGRENKKGVMVRTRGDQKRGTKGRWVKGGIQPYQKRRRQERSRHGTEEGGAYFLLRGRNSKKDSKRGGKKVHFKNTAGEI